MDVERTDLAARAARHAALAEPVRLRIVDLLTLGDLSPKELQDELGLSSSLLAHHLNVLAEHHMIQRTRSEADRRRSYVRLIADAFDGLGPSSSAAARRVVFVCTANSARSQLAAALWARESIIPATSAGTHPAAAVDPAAIAVAKLHGLDLSGAAPSALTGVLRESDVVITVCDNAHEELDHVGALHWSVPDPVARGGAAAFEAAYEELSRRIEILAPRLATAS